MAYDSKLLKIQLFKRRVSYIFNIIQQYYSKYIKHPFATTLGEEIFQLGIIPSDTDFRNFRDYGHIPGKFKSTTWNNGIFNKVP